MKNKSSRSLELSSVTPVIVMEILIFQADRTFLAYCESLRARTKKEHFFSTPYIIHFQYYSYVEAFIITENTSDCRQSKQGGEKEKNQARM